MGIPHNMFNLHSVYRTYIWKSLLSLLHTQQVFRHTVDMCNTFTSCSECLTSGDPICGWCPLSGMCTRQSNCANVPPVSTPIWLTDNNTCPSISAIDPSIVYFPQLNVSCIGTILCTIFEPWITTYVYSLRYQHVHMSVCSRGNVLRVCKCPEGKQRVYTLREYNHC